MAWGLWNKIKRGFKRAGKAVKAVAQVVNDNVVQPLKPIIKTAATAIGNHYVPGMGTMVANAVDDFSDGVDAVASGRSKQWMSKRFGRRY